MKFNIFHRRKKKAPKIHWKVKSEKKMGNYVALHLRIPKLSKEFGIEKGQLLVRRDWWKDPVKRKRLKVHESVELNFMDRGVPYYKAHKIANIFKHNAIKHIRGKNKKWGIGFPHS